MEINYNMRLVGTCKYIRKVFASEQLLLDKKFDRGKSKRLVDNCLDMVIKIYKYSKTFKVVSTTMTEGVGKVTKWEVKDSITAKLPKGIITYQKYMGRIYRGDQHRMMG